jgi:cytidylate kinase
MGDNGRVEEMSRLIQARLDEWRLRGKDPQYRPKPVVAITREPGCGAESVAERLCAELGMHLFDWEVVEQIAQDARVSTELVSSIEKNPRSEFVDFGGDLLSEFQKVYYFSSEEYLDSLKRVFLAIVVPGNAIIVGRGSNFFLPQDKRIGLCFVAPLSVRIQNLMKQLSLTEKAARKHISKLEAEHQKLVKKYFQADIRDPDHYHLVINTALIKPETIVQMIKAMIQDAQAPN